MNALFCYTNYAFHSLLEEWANENAFFRLVWQIIMRMSLLMLIEEEIFRGIIECSSYGIACYRLVSEQKKTRG